MGARDYWYIMALVRELREQEVPDEALKSLVDWTEENCRK